MNITGNYFEVELDLTGGDTLAVFMTLQDNQCSETTETTFIGKK